MDIPETHAGWSPGGRGGGPWHQISIASGCSGRGACLSWPAAEMLTDFRKWVVQGIMAPDLKGLGLLKQEGVFLCHQTQRPPFISDPRIRLHIITFWNRQPVHCLASHRGYACQMHLCVGHAEAFLHGARGHGDGFQRPGAAQVEGPDCVPPDLA